MIRKNMRTFWAKFENKLIVFCGALVLLLSAGLYFSINGISGYSLSNIAPGIFGDIGPSDDEVAIAMKKLLKSDFKVKSVKSCDIMTQIEGDLEAIIESGVEMPYGYNDFLDMAKCWVTYAPVFPGQSDMVTQAVMDTKKMAFVKLKSAGGWVLHKVW